MESKELTVLMTVCNEALPVLKASIKSILDQTIQNFEVQVIIDNPSNFEAIEYLRILTEEDERIHLLINNDNLGLALSLNRGIDLINTPYIARMDADDICFPNRFQLQLNYLKEHPEIDLVGANIIYMDFSGKIIKKRGSIPSSHHQIKAIAKYENVFSHPTLMGKTSVFKSIKYRNLRYSQDYDFTSRIIEQGFCVYNFSSPLLYYRLGNSLNDYKMAYQIVAKHFIQKYYKERILSKIDIVKIVEQNVANVDCHSLSLGEQFYNLSLNALKQKKLVSFIKYAFKANLSSPLIKERFLNLLLYYLSKVIYCKL